MSETGNLLSILREAADARAVDAIEAALERGPDRGLCRINALAFADKQALDEEKTVSAFLHASRIGLFDMSWNVLCPGCGGVLDANASLKTVLKDEYVCALCAGGYSPTLDEMVEVTFTVSPRVRKIAAHDPDELPLAEYFRQIYWGSGVDLPEEGFEQAIEGFVLEDIELPPGEKAILSIQLPRNSSSSLNQ